MGAPWWQQDVFRPLLTVEFGEVADRVTQGAAEATRPHSRTSRVPGLVLAVFAAVDAEEFLFHGVPTPWKLFAARTFGPLYND